MSTPSTPPSLWVPGPSGPAIHPFADQGQPAAEPSPVLVATLRRRAAAYLIDAIVAGFATLVVLIVVLLIGAGASGGSFSVNGTVDANSTSSDLLRFAGLSLVGFVGPFALIGLLPALGGVWRGRTIGKRALELQVITAEGNPLSRNHAIGRAVVLFGPSFFALVFGPLLDAAAGTSPLFTFLLFAASTLFSLADFVLYPVLGTMRRSVHDRASGTVVVDCRTAPPFVPAAEGAEPVATPPAGRPKTAGTWTGVVAAGGLLAIAALVLLITALTAGHTSSSSPDSTADRGFGPVTTGGAGSGSSASVPSNTGTLKIAAPPYGASELVVDGSTSVRGAQRVALRLGVEYLRCLARTKAASTCVTAGQIGLPGNIPITPTEDLTGDPAKIGQVIVGHADVNGAPHALIGIYGPGGTLWAVGVTSTFDVAALCDGTADVDCSQTADGKAFISDIKVADRVIALSHK